MPNATKIQDRDELFKQMFEAKQRDFLRTLVTTEVAEEHRIAPCGQHSEPLDRLLLYFNRRPLSERYAIMTIEPFKAYRVVALSGQRGVPPKDVDNEIYPSHIEAQHAIFLRNVQELLES
ncbi:hypothetical protein [Bradyrhizobium uaiense]|uniref:N,N-dimethylformamidase alpha subunit domain-containing protein n=1 Tax=Bradyrhizobium uaiense TaxID=2594946 RepID=A0A6P1BFR0_9BRAD|nr:hypothetical protein [Bradyrhizobium uaiense]NEU96322.1 hypothetical protein [Bradyrhizobium uaiense]